MEIKAQTHPVFPRSKNRFPPAILIPCLALLLVGLGFSTNVGAEPLVLAAGGETAYQVVLPRTAADPVVGEWLRQAGRLMQAAFKANDADLPVAVEGEHDPRRPCIYLGDTQFARARGVDVSTFRGWSYLHRVVGPDLIIAGRDQAPPKIDAGAVGFRTDFLYPRVATVKGVTDFLRDHAGTRFLFPELLDRIAPERVPEAIAALDLRETAAIEYLAMAEIAVPSDLDVHKTFAIEYNATAESGRRQSFWDIANNFFPFFDVAYFAHSWDKAVPADNFFESHPEYFALIDGERRKINHYCLSSEGFREQLYQWHRNWLEQGLSMVSIEQQDGFRPCECENCRNLYGTGDDWGEKLWIFHREFAERLKQDLPDKLIMLVPYALTADPPKSFDAFPDNVVIHIVGGGTNQGDFEAWSRVSVPGGFSAKPHNWITNQAPRYAPIRTPRSMEIQQKRLYEFKVRGLARDFFQGHGLSGPTYYVLGGMWRDPANTRAADLVREYVEAAFGEAAEPMRDFYDRLYHAVELYASVLGTRNPAWTYTDIYGRRHKHVSNPFQMLGFLYPPTVLESLDRSLDLAEAAAGSEKTKNRLDLVRHEFEWLRQLVEVVHLYHAHRVAPDDRAVQERLLDAIDARNRFIDEVLYAGGRHRPNPGMPFQMFPPGGHRASHLRLEEDRYQERWSDTPVNWDTAARREALASGEKTLSAGRVPGPPALDDPAWEHAGGHALAGPPGGGKPAAATVVRALYDEAHLYLRFDADLPPPTPGNAAAASREEALSRRESLDVYLDPEPGRGVYYRFMVGPEETAKYDAASGLITDPMNLLYDRDDPAWNGAWRYRARLEPQRGRWLALIAIPFETLAVRAPQEGAAWRGNFGRVHPDDSGRLEHSIWAGVPAPGGMDDRGAFGRIIFAGPAGPPR